jgi:hypothetical protein
MASIISAGTTSATALNMSADTTGILQLASNNGTVALTVSTAQYIGVNTTSPTTVFHTVGANGTYATSLADTATYAKLRFQNTSASSFSLFQGITNSSNPTWYLQVANGPGTGSYDIAINPFGSNVGIGTVAPGVALEVWGNTSYAGKVTQLILKDTTAMAADTGGYMQFSGNYTTVGDQAVYGGIGAFKENSTSGQYGGYLTLTTRTNGSLPAERMRITSSGQVMVNTTSLTGSPDQMQMYPATTGSFQYGMMIGGNGSTYTVYAMRFLNTYTPAVVGSITIGASSTAFNTSSDYRLKENIAPITGALAKVAQLKPVTYKWKIDGSDGEGFIAHELAEVVPQAVTGEKDAVEEDGTPHYQGIDTSFLVATLTAAIQELNAKVTALENK